MVDSLIPSPTTSYTNGIHLRQQLIDGLNFTGYGKPTPYEIKDMTVAFFTPCTYLT